MRLKKVDVPIESLPGHLSGYRILLVSDIHIANVFRPELMDKVEKILKETKADVLLFAGDFLDGEATDRKLEQAARFNAGNFPDGRFAVFGNHDRYSETPESAKALSVAGFRVLRQEGVVIHEGLWLAGSEAPENFKGQTDYLEQIPKVQDGCLGILLRHHPDVPPYIQEANYKLMLSGHIHGGQIFPFGIVIKFRYPKAHIIGKIFNNSEIQQYISPGTGYWGPAVRVLARPEVTLLTLTSK